MTTASPSQTTESPAQKKTANIVTAVLALLILIPSLWGFGSKFIEFVALYRGDVDGVFAISPIMNYLLASLGFFCLLCWAALNGMFHDIERPKQTLLETERQLDARPPHPRADHKTRKATYP